MMSKSCTLNVGHTFCMPNRGKRLNTIDEVVTEKRKIENETETTRKKSRVYASGMPVTWYLGFACQYQDGKRGNEGKMCNMLTEFKFKSNPPTNWYSNEPLSEWEGIHLNTTLNACTDDGDFTSFVSLEKICLPNKQLISLPRSCDLLMSLKCLDVSHNQLTTLPEYLNQIDTLTKLDISNNVLTQLRECIGNLVYLKELNISGSRLASLPRWICELPRLRILNVSDNELTHLPEQISHLTHLTNLDVSYNALTVLPISITRLKSLGYLDISHNQIETLPESFCNFKKIHTLYMESNRLSSLFSSIQELSLLQILDVSDNVLTSLPNLASLESLVWADVQENLLSQDEKGRIEAISDNIYV